MRKILRLVLSTVIYSGIVWMLYTLLIGSIPFINILMSVAVINILASLAILRKETLYRSYSFDFVSRHGIRYPGDEKMAVELDKNCLRAQGRAIQQKDDDEQIEEFLYFMPKDEITSISYELVNDGVPFYEINVMSGPMILSFATHNKQEAVSVVEEINEWRNEG